MTSVLILSYLKWDRWQSQSHTIIVRPFGLVLHVCSFSKHMQNVYIIYCVHTENVFNQIFVIYCSHGILLPLADDLDRNLKSWESASNDFCLLMIVPLLLLSLPPNQTPASSLLLFRLQAECNSCLQLRQSMQKMHMLCHTLKLTQLAEEMLIHVYGIVLYFRTWKNTYTRLKIHTSASLISLVDNSWRSCLSFNRLTSSQLLLWGPHSKELWYERPDEWIVYNPASFLGGFLPPTIWFSSWTNLRSLWRRLRMGEGDPIGLQLLRRINPVQDKIVIVWIIIQVNHACWRRHYPCW